MDQSVQIAQKELEVDKINHLSTYKLFILMRARAQLRNVIK